MEKEQKCRFTISKMYRSQKGVYRKKKKVGNTLQVWGKLRTQDTDLFCFIGYTTRAVCTRS